MHHTLYFVFYLCGCCRNILLLGGCLSFSAFSCLFWASENGSSLDQDGLKTLMGINKDFPHIFPKFHFCDVIQEQWK